MKLIYGKSYCTLHYGIENVKSVVIKYKGSISIKHQHMEFVQRINRRSGIFNNFNQKSILIHNYNQIRIGFAKEVVGEIELFRWVGDFKILSAKVNKKNIPVEVFGVDYCEMINSTFDSMGKPEQYRGSYKFGRVPKRRRRMKRKRLTTGTTGTTRTTTGRSGGGGY